MYNYGLVLTGAAASEVLRNAQAVQHLGTAALSKRPGNTNKR